MQDKDGRQQRRKIYEIKNVRILEVKNEGSETEDEKKDSKNRLFHNLKRKKRKKTGKSDINGEKVLQTVEGNGGRKSGGM